MEWTYGIEVLKFSLVKQNPYYTNIVKVPTLLFTFTLLGRTRMCKFDVLTKYIPVIQADRMGEWVIDKENDGTPERPKQMPFVGYSGMVHHFIDDVYTFEKNNKDMELTRYYDILKDNGIEWSTESMKNADVSEMSAQCALALIMGAVRAERFCDGALLDFFRSGSILKWLERLNNI